MSSLPRALGGRRRHLVVGAVFCIGLGGLYLIAAAVNGLAPFGSAATPRAGSGAAEPPPAAAAAQGPGTTVAGVGTPSLDELMPDAGCDTSPARVTQGLAGLTDALQCTNDHNLSSVVVDGYQFGDAAAYATGLQAIDRTLGFHPAGASPACPPTGSASGSVAWQSSDFPRRPGQVLQCLVAAGRPTYLWTIPSRLAFIEAIDTAEKDGYSGLQDWFVNDAQP